MKTKNRIPTSTYWEYLQALAAIHARVIASSSQARSS